METERIRQIQDSSWEETITIVDLTMADSTVGLTATLVGEGGDRWFWNQVFDFGKLLILFS